MAELHMLTTPDNPWDPFTQFEDWQAYDTQAGYHTTSLIARVLVSSDELSEADQDLAWEQALDDIVTETAFGPYRKVTKETFGRTQPQS